MDRKIEFTRSGGSSVIEKRKMKNFILNNLFLLILRQGYWNRIGVVSNDDEKRNKWKKYAYDCCSRTSLQRLSWGQKKEAVVERFKQESMYGLCTKKKWPL